MNFWTAKRTMTNMKSIKYETTMQMVNMELIMLTIKLCDRIHYEKTIPCRHLQEDCRIIIKVFCSTDDRDVSRPSIPLRMRVVSGSIGKNRTTKRR